MTPFDSVLWKIWNLKINILWLHIKLTVAGKKKTMSIASNAEAEDLLGDSSFLSFLFSNLCLSIWSKGSVFRNDTPGKGGGGGARLYYSIQMCTKPSEIICVSGRGGRQAALRGLLISVSSLFGAFFSTAGLWALHPGVESSLERAHGSGLHSADAHILRTIKLL